MHIDILAFTGHKSLYGIPGIGGAYIREGLEVQPLKVGGTGVRSDYLFQPEDGPLLYEAGTQNLPGVAALNAGLAHITSRGVDRIRQRKEELVQLFLEGLSGRKGLSLHPPASARQRTTMVSLNVDGMDPADVGYVLEHGFGIVVRSGLHCAPLIHRHLGTHPRGSVRISPSHFTSEEDMEALSEALGQTLQMAA
jgi:selenocysteine lyase/cysteine desulfurase